MGVKMTIFKITSKHISEYKELEHHDLGLYALKIAEDKEVMIYETKAVAEKALEYFKNSFKR
tara:strand:- start:823 stop:1008 length:186 start_codon:yes stop_codon:yes gene_type:complete